jgi:hypothetical protein
MILRGADCNFMTFLTKCNAAVTVFALGVVTTGGFIKNHVPGVQGATLRTLPWQLFPPRLIYFMGPNVTCNPLGLGGNVDNRRVFPQHEALHHSMLEGGGEVEPLDNDRLS